MNYQINAITSLLIGIPALVGWIRINRIDRTYLPFLILLTAGFLNEMISLLIMESGYSNAVNFNLYSLAESLLLLWQFARWKAFDKRTVYWLTQTALVAFWVWESFVYSTIGVFNSFHLMAYSAVVVLLSINLLNRVVYTAPGRLLKNACFLICIGLAVFCTYTILVEIFWLYGLNENKDFRERMLLILPLINLFCNLLFTFALLWAPTSYRYIMQC